MGKSTNNPINLVITGAGGQLGRELNYLLENNNLFNARFYDRSQLNICKEVDLQQELNNVPIDFLINCAAYTAVDLAEDNKEEAFLINAEAVKYLSEICKKKSATLVHISTDYVFDGSENQPYSEERPTNPLGVYGASKLEGEVNAFQSGAKAVIIRTSWLYSTFGNNFFKTMSRLGKEKESLGIVYDQVGTPTWVRSLADAILQMCLQLKEKNANTLQEIYHLSNEGVTSWYDFAAAIMELKKLPCEVNPILSSEYPTKAKRPAYSVLDKKKFKTNFGFSLGHWRKALETCIKDENRL